MNFTVTTVNPFPGLCSTSNFLQISGRKSWQHQTLLLPPPFRCAGAQGFNTSQDYQVKGLIPAGALCSIYGPGGSFKSFLAVSLACHIASGTSWGGRRINQGAVLFIFGEGGTSVSRRIRA
ncbi:MULTISPECIES: AAA family ATPase [Lelliottia]|uniref:AAA family ATPase n=1 Tax=Lelliottia sp. JS-SCA-14 TaxID=3110110 RepID=UPI003A5CD762